MSLVKVSNQTFENSPVFALIYGTPGSGKTTLACSAPKPLIIDLDNDGMKRVDGKQRKDTLKCETIDELEEDLKSEEVRNNYETIVIDTGGALDDCIIKKLKELSYTQKDNSLSLKGYGILGEKIISLVNFVLKDLKKNLVIIYHTETKEVKKDNETINKNTVLSVGKSKNIIWSMADLGIFVTRVGKVVYADMRPSDENYAKSCTALCDKWNITLDENKPNDFLTKCFNIIRESWKNDAEEEKVYNREIEYKQIIENCKTQEDLNNCLAVLTSKTTPFQKTTIKELLSTLKQKAKELGCEYAKEHKRFDVISNSNAN